MRLWLVVVLAIAGCSSLSDRIQRIDGTSGSTLSLAGSVNDLATLDLVPEPVRNGAIKHLRDRAGDFFPRLAFARAEQQVEPEGTKYALYFTFSDAQAGIGRCEVKIVLDVEGRVLEGPTLPDFRAAPQKMAFVPWGQIVEVARREGFDGPHPTAMIAYSAKHDAIAWLISQPLHPRADQGEYRTLTVDAHSGAVLDRGTGVYWSH